jgi:hypothetical protein
MMNLGILIFIWLPLLGLQALPASVRTQLFQGLQGMDPLVLTIILFCGLILVDIALFYWAVRRFQREKLILNEY